ncbi:TPA: hypothetical protein DIV49_01730 [Candidatus Saccharibacteria bacterium]|nr:hypothetical protein [Candidatus Saccharibacteria bacterium]HRJ91060.1 pyridoxamine 5'-phosphate oxidase family protein [Candidatus Saccharibacteria bacterium]
MNDSEKLRNFLQSATHMVVAVLLPDGTPWVVPVRIKNWQGKEFEWDSKVDTQHSLAIGQNPTMAVTIFQKQEDAQIGVYMKGHGELVEQKDDDFGRYKFTAEQVWLNDETFVKREVEL